MADYAPTRNTYSSTGPVWARDLLKAETHGRQLNGDLFLAAFPTGVVPSGTGVMKVTAGGLGAPVGTTAATPDGYLVNEIKVAAGSRPLEAVLHAGTVTERFLPGAAAPAGFKAALPAVSHI